MMSNFGTQIRTRREELGLSQTALSSAVGVSQAAISRLESCEECPSDFRLLNKLAKALKQPVAEFLPENQSQDLEEFFAFCPNPHCQTNSHNKKQGTVLVFWSSWASYPANEFGEINFCPSCGTSLIKECQQCKRRFPKEESRYCIRCGEKICNRPTPEEWAALETLYSPPPRSDEDIPF